MLLSNKFLSAAAFSMLKFKAFMARLVSGLFSLFFHVLMGFCLVTALGCCVAMVVLAAKVSFEYSWWLSAIVTPLTALLLGGVIWQSSLVGIETGQSWGRLCAKIIFLSDINRGL